MKLLEEPCDLGAILRGVVDDLDEGRRRRIVLESDNAAARVFVDASKVERAITNLVTHALESLEYSPDEAVVRVVLARESEDVVVEVVDRGIGIAPEYVPRRFERYYRVPTLKRFAGLGLGLGLGLYITGQIVKAHGGRIEVVSAVGSGSTFRLVLPSRGTQA